MKLVLVRHGRPDEADETRPHDPPLHPQGRAQAEAVAALLARESITRVVASPLLRARETADPLARCVGLPVEVVDGWAEADRHLPRYRSGETLRSQGTAEWKRFLQDPLAFLGCDAAAFRSSVLGALGQLSARAPGGHVAVFTHGLVINLVLSQILGLERIVHFQPGYASLTRLDVRAVGRLAIISVNETGHHAVAAAPESALT